MSSELNSANGGTELHLEIYTNPLEQVNTHTHTQTRCDVKLTVHLNAHQKTEYLISHIK